MSASFRLGHLIWTVYVAGPQSPSGEGGPIDRRLAVCGKAMVPLREDSREEGVCPICQEHLKEAVSTDCGHLFCQVCLAQHVEKSHASGVLCCPLCRKPCSEGVLGAGYVCHSHQKKVCWFCEESRLLLCMECLVSPEHKSHCELAIENAISHYKVRPSHHFLELLPPTPCPPCLACHRGSVAVAFLCFFCFILFWILVFAFLRLFCY